MISHVTGPVLLTAAELEREQGTAALSAAHEARLVAHTARVQADCARLGIRGREREPLTDEQIAEVRQLRQSGWGCDRIAQVVGTSRGRVRVVLARVDQEGQGDG